MTNLGSVLKSRDITLLTNVRIVKAILFPVVTYGCDSGTVKKAECQRIDAFKLWCWRRLLKVPWTQEIKPVNFKQDQPWIFTWRADAEAEAPVFWSSDVNSLEKSLMLAKIEARGEQGIRGWDGWMASPMQWTWTWANSRRWWGTGRPGVLQSMGLQRVGQAWATKQEQHQQQKLYAFSFMYINLKVSWSYKYFSTGTLLWMKGGLLLI